MLFPSHDQAQQRAIKMFSADEYTHMITKSPRGGMTITTKRAWKFSGGSSMSEELEQMILRYLSDMADRGDYEAKELFDMLSEEGQDDQEA